MRHNDPVTDVLLSYAIADRQLAASFAGAMDRAGISVWLDLRDLVYGDSVDELANRALTDAELVVLLVTPHSLDSESIRRQWREAIASASRVVPVVTTDVADLPPELRHIQFLRLGSRSEVTGAYSSVVAALASMISSVRSRPLTQPTQPFRLTCFPQPLNEIKGLISTGPESIDIAANSLGGSLSPIPDLLSGVARATRIRVVLPDPDYFTDPYGGRNLELASGAESSIASLSSRLGRAASLRVVSTTIRQSMLRVDDQWFVDAFPAMARSSGFVRVTRSSAEGGLFAAFEAAFEALYMSGREWRGELTDWDRSQEDSRSGSSTEAGLELATIQYFTKRGYEATTGVSDRYDLLLWRPEGGPPSIVEIKIASRALPSSVVERAVEAASRAGAERVYIVSNQAPSAAASSVASQLARQTRVLVEFLSSDRLNSELNRSLGGM